MFTYSHEWAFLVAQQYRILLQCRRRGFDSWVRKIPWKRKWQPTPAFLPRKSHGQRSLAGFSPQGHKRVGSAAWEAPAVCISSVQSLSHVLLFETPWTAAHQAFLSITNSRSLLKLTSIESEMPSNHLILCGPLLLRPSIFPSSRVFSNESVLALLFQPLHFGNLIVNSLERPDEYSR